MNTMKNLIKIALAALLLGAPSFAQQNLLTATTTSASMTANTRNMAVTSATNFQAPTVSQAGSQVWIQDLGETYGEVATVIAVNSTTITLQRIPGQTTAHASGALVLVGQPNWFYKFNPTGTCTTASTYVSPWLNTLTGQQWLCSTITKTWVPGWGTLGGGTAQVTAAVASVAGATAVNGPLQHITGTNAITSFTMGAGWYGEGFCIVPDAIFTATATNNIALASTAVVNKTLCYTWDATNSKFTPSY